MLQLFWHLRFTIKVKNVPIVQLVGIFVQWVFALNKKTKNQNDLLLDLNLMLEWKICQLEIFMSGDNGQVALDHVDLVSGSDTYFCPDLK